MKSGQIIYKCIKNLKIRDQNVNVENNCNVHKHPTIYWGIKYEKSKKSNVIRGNHQRINIYIVNGFVWWKKIVRVLLSSERL